MVLCPIARVSSCDRCPILHVCPAKAVIGDYKPPRKSDHQGK